MNLPFKREKEGAVQQEGRQLSAYEQAKAFRRLRISVTTNIKDLLLITGGILSASFGLESFLLPNNFVDGGATGISLLLAEVSRIPVSVYLVIINIPFVIIGSRTIGNVFALKTASGIVALALAVAFIHFPVVTNDKLLVAVFGGFFLGAGIGLSVRGGGVIDGTEVLAIFLSRRLGITIGDVILIFNILIFSAAAYVLNVETALYSVLTYLSASKTVDFIIEGIEEYTGVTIISPKHEDIRKMIVEVLGRGVTVYRGRRGFGRTGESTADRDIVYTIVTRLEVSRLNAEIEKIDPNAFVVMSSVKDTKGGMIKKRPLNH
ncbi:MAG: YitT family protein [Williamsia sp.]|nr:YitT family protein [Williamsia sp.]